MSKQGRDGHSLLTTALQVVGGGQVQWLGGVHMGSCDSHCLGQLTTSRQGLVPGCVTFSPCLHTQQPSNRGTVGQEPPAEPFHVGVQ